MPTKEELLAHDKNINEMCQYIHVSLKFLSLGGLYKVLTKVRNNNYPHFSDHYFTGEYPLNRR